ncbi:37S ribosomal protein SWS2, mitochondrial [Leucoagaricus sp. SymC.cos]|nr:37S ribosomal protein SWS2, mitochondrial [Leucoagaricus sp. SymC.cos]
MVHILGVQLRDHCLARVALIQFYGVGLKTAHRLCARLQIHDRARVKDLTPVQITSLASFLSSPATAPPLPEREIRENIAHQRMIGSYVGKRHAMHLPVRGQNTQTNAKTAKKLNQLDRY